MAEEASVLEETGLSWRSRSALALGLVLAVATGILVGDRQYGTLPFTLWLGSLVLVGLALPDGAPRPRRWDRHDLAAMALILGLSAFLRFHRLGAVPSGLWTDEVSTVRNALSLPRSPFCRLA